MNKVQCCPDCGSADLTNRVGNDERAPEAVVGEAYCRDCGETVTPVTRERRANIEGPTIGLAAELDSMDAAEVLGDD